MLEKRENLNFFKRFPVIKTSRLILRDIQLKDARLFFEIRSDEGDMKYMDRKPFKSMDDAKKMIDSCIDAYEKGSGINWAITLKGSIKKCDNNYCVSRESQLDLPIQSLLSF
jgi:RimJ/RimL family protein N-acetyltransferase